MTQPVTIYKYKHLKYGFEDCSLHDHSTLEDSDHLLLATGQVTFTPVKTPEEILAAEIAALKKQETEIRAVAQAQVQAIQDKIQSLLSITHEQEA